MIGADVLDAWFPPAPTVATKLGECLSWELMTSPPADCAGMVSAISEARGLPRSSIVVGTGPSSLICVAFNRWLAACSRVLLVQPLSTEYRYICETVIKCHVDTLSLNRCNGFELDLEELVARCSRTQYDLVVIVNPNNPTGVVLRRDRLTAALSHIPRRTKVWIDEAYIDDVEENNSVEAFAA